MGKPRSPHQLSHLDAAGKARMVDVSGKESTMRRAVAESFVRLSAPTVALISKGKLPKGDAIETARLAGIVAAKRTSELIPLCHPLLLTHIEVQARPLKTGVRFLSTVTCAGKTGVEMEALVAVSVAALTLYDMVKAVEKGAVIERIWLVEKTGGKSGVYRGKPPRR
jgi:cyclic pyranopterin phosphate synthase